MRKNPQTNILSGYYRLVESYRNGDNRICHRTILSAGFLDDLTTDQLNLIQKILTAKVANSSNVAFEVPYSSDTTVNQYVDQFYKRICDEKRIDIEPDKQNVRKLANKDKNSDWREIVRIANTQKAVTTTAQNSDENIIVIRNCSEPTQKAKLLYNTLKYKYYPFTKKKSVVLKSKFKNYQMHEQPIFWSQ